MGSKNQRQNASANQQTPKGAMAKYSNKDGTKTISLPKSTTPTPPPQPSPTGPMSKNPGVKSGVSATSEDTTPSSLAAAEMESSAPTVNRKKAKRRAKQAAKLAAAAEAEAEAEAEAGSARITSPPRSSMEINSGPPTTTAQRDKHGKQSKYPVPTNTISMPNKLSKSLAHSVPSSHIPQHYAPMPPLHDAPNAADWDEETESDDDDDDEATPSSQIHSAHLHSAHGYGHGHGHGHGHEHGHGHRHGHRHMQSGGGRNHDHNHLNGTAGNSKKGKKKKQKMSTSAGADASAGTGVAGNEDYAPRRSGISKEKIWNTSSAEERERIKQFWLGLSEKDRKSLVKVEKDTVLKKMKEQQKHTCSCTVCGRKRTAIEEELEGLYDAYYQELESFANRPSEHPHGPPFMGNPRKLGLHARPFPPGAAAYHGHPPPPPRGTRMVEHMDPDQDDVDQGENDVGSDLDDGQDSYSEEDDLDEDEDDEGEEVDDLDEEEEPQDPQDMPRDYAHDFFNFGQSLTVQGGILTVADDLLKNDGKKFIDMMEQLAERRMAREEDAKDHFVAGFARPSTTVHRGNPPEAHNHPPLEEEDEDDEDYEEEEEEEEEEGYESPEEEYDEEETMTEEQRMEEGRRMFQIFAARMFEQRVLTAYKQKVAEERQKKLLEELDLEDTREAERAAKKAKEAKKKKEKAAQKKQMQLEEKARKEAEKKVQEAEKLAEEQQRLADQKAKAEEKRKKKEAQKKAEEEERHKKEADRVRRANEQRERQAEQERKARESKEREKKLKEEQRIRDKEVREQKERETRERREKHEKDKRDKEQRAAQAKAERDAKEKQKQEEKAAQKAAALVIPVAPSVVAHPPVPPAAPIGPAASTAPVSTPIAAPVTPVAPVAPVATPPILSQPIPTHPASKKSQPQVMPVLALPHQPPHNHASPQISVATPVFPKAPTPMKPRAVSHETARSMPPASIPVTTPIQAPFPHPQTPVHPSPIRANVRPPTTGAGILPPNLPGSPLHGGIKSPPGFNSQPFNMGVSPNGPHHPPGMPVPGFNPMANPAMPPANYGRLQNMPAPPPGLGHPMARNFSIPGAPPPGFPAPGEPMLGLSQSFPIGTDGGPGQVSPHSRRTSSGFEPSSLSNLDKNTGHSAPIARPTPIGRPSSVVHGMSHMPDNRPKGGSEDVSRHLGSSALLDDSSDPLDDLNPPRRSIGTTAPGPRAPFGGAPFMDTVYGSSLGQTWGQPNVFSPPPGFVNPAWPPNSSFRVPSHNQRLSQSRSVTARQLLCQAHTNLAATSADPDGFVEISAVKAHIDHINPTDFPMSEQELLELCDTEGDMHNGGGNFEVREDPKTTRKRVRYDRADGFVSSGSGPIGAPGDIGSPLIGVGAGALGSIGVPDT